MGKQVDLKYGIHTCSDGCCVDGIIEVHVDDELIGTTREDDLTGIVELVCEGLGIVDVEVNFR